MDISDWLRGLDLAQYEAVFRENAIDLDILPELTETDLEKLGVLLGHRKRMLRAIAALGESPAQPAEEQTPRKDAAERRQLTVMFCDLVGSTALSTRFDPEDLREMIGAYHRCVAETVARFAGFVAKYMGDGVLVYFGYPEAHEDDAERAVRAGLAVIDAVGRLATPEPLKRAARHRQRARRRRRSDRRGCGTGARGRRRDAEPRGPAAGAGRAGHARHRREHAAADRRAVRDRGSRAATLAGFAEPQRAWRVVRRKRRRQPLRGAALGGNAARRARRGARPVAAALAAGEGRRRAGGARSPASRGSASRASPRRCRERIENEPHTRLRYFCSPYHQDSALYPFIVQLERAAGFARDDTVEAEARQAASAARAEARGDDEFALLAELLSLPNSAADLNLSPQRKREKLFEALAAPARSPGAAAGRY